mgnify:CR=1 FL=1
MAPDARQTDRDDEARYIRFDGILQEDLEFDFRPGWETARVFRQPDEGTGEFVLELRDEEDEVLTRVSPDVDFRSGCMTEENETMAATRVLAYVPYHRDARRLVFRREDAVIFEASVAPEAPSVELNAVELTDEQELHLEWSAEPGGDRELTYNVVYQLDGERYFPLARGLSQTEVDLDLSNVPGGGTARVAVLATDGIRSSFAASEPFEAEGKPPRAWIQRPTDGATLPPDQPVSLIGQALDVAGASLPPDGLVWEVDGDVVAEGSRLAVADDLQPGEHEITLTYRAGKEARVSETITVRISARNEEQERHRQLMQRRGR